MERRCLEGGNQSRGRARLEAWGLKRRPLPPERATARGRSLLRGNGQREIPPPWLRLVSSPFNCFSSPFLKTLKTIKHPGEVTRIRELPQNNKIVATHTDSPDVFIWDVEAHPNCYAVREETVAHPNLILKGHTKDANFALAMCSEEPFVLSGGEDKSVVLWSIQDHISSLAEASSTVSLATSSGCSSSKLSAKVGNDKSPDHATVRPRGVFQGHEGTVEDVQFSPTSPQEFCSVGNDCSFVLWDARTGTSPVVKVSHSTRLHCVDWNPHEENYILTGAGDGSVLLYDRRSLNSGGSGVSVRNFQRHGDNAGVLTVQWSPHKSSVFGSSTGAGLNIWDHEMKVGHDRAPDEQCLIMRHAGQRHTVYDFHWNPSEPWTIASISNDMGYVGGSGTLQIWRISDLVYATDLFSDLETFDYDDCIKFLSS